jgi:osmoprotectant transport system ATP-binding protein
MIALNHVSKSFDGGKTFAVRDLSFEVADGEFLALLGSSGSGKTTALKMINRLIEPSEGSIFVGGRNVLEQDPVRLRRSIGYVFQGIGLFPHMTIRQNAEIIPRLLGVPPQERRKRTEAMLELVGLPFDDYAGRYPDELSGGQRQRVGVARALAADPGCLLMDEPFGALDALTRDALQHEVLSLKRRLGKTFVLVTHDVFEALALGDRIAVMHGGNLEQIGPKEEIVGNPATPFVRELFEKPARQMASFRELL